MRRNGDRFLLWAAGVAGVVLLAALLAVAVAYFTFLRPRTSIRSLRDLPPSTPVHLIGVVTYADNPGNRFWMEDETGVAVIPISPGSAGVQAGQTVVVDARKMGRYDPAQGPASLSLQNSAHPLQCERTSSFLRPSRQPPPTFHNLKRTAPGLRSTASSRISTQTPRGASGSRSPAGEGRWM